jgi:hypothetical protein
MHMLPYAHERQTHKILLDDKHFHDWNNLMMTVEQNLEVLVIQHFVGESGSSYRIQQTGYSVPYSFLCGRQCTNVCVCVLQETVEVAAFLMYLM